ncbi:MAG: ABC transporter permease [Actinobacteria bacterium]|jgi:osmoprotectant transport system permease protein|nr:ABC transporter permease [Actinomycetota bacterium]
MSSFLEYLAFSWDHVLELAIGHAIVVAISLAIAAVIGMSLGVLVYRRERAADVALAITSTFLTIPSFALFGLFIPIFGLGYKPVIIGLVMYALLPILRNTVAGLRSVDPAIVESAKGMGMNARQQLLRIEMPLAWPVILAGVRVSTMLLMGIAAIGAVIGGPGLGEDFFSGLARIGSATALNLVLGAMLAIIVLALLFDTFFNLLGKLTTPRGIRD